MASNSGDSLGARGISQLIECLLSLVISNRLVDCWSAAFGSFPWHFGELVSCLLLDDFGVITQGFSLGTVAQPL